MEQETLYNILSGGYGEILETHAMWQCISALGIKPFKDGNQWCFLYGEDIQEGVCGFGETIFKAAWDFYTNIKTKVVSITPEPELSKFEKAVRRGFVCGGLENVTDGVVKDTAAELLALAKKEIEKDLPRWKKCGENTLRSYGDEHFEYRKDGCYVVIRGREILLSDIEKLPKEEE